MRRETRTSTDHVRDRHIVVYISGERGIGSCGLCVEDIDVLEQAQVTAIDPCNLNKRIWPPVGRAIHSPGKKQVASSHGGAGESRVNAVEPSPPVRTQR